MTHAVKRAFDHVLIIMFENQYRSYALENDYLRNLAAQGIDLANYFGVMHPSQTNYIASIAGELCNVTSDEPISPLLQQRTIVDLIEESPYGLEWKAYMQSYVPQDTPWTQNVVPRDRYPYVIKHNPFSSFTRIVHNQSRWRRITDEAELWQDLLNGTLPEYAWFTPNMWNDGHYIDGTHKEPKDRAPFLIDQLARWLKAFFGALRFPGPESRLPPRTLVVVTFDEADYEASYDQTRKYTYDGPNQIYTVLLGDMITPGYELEGYNHYSLLRTIEKNFGLASLGKNDAAANWFQFLWDRRFRWQPPQATPITTAVHAAAATLDDLLHVVYQTDDGFLRFRTFDGTRWHAEQEIGHRSAGRLALATGSDTLHLIFQPDEETLASLTYSFNAGWSSEPQLLAHSPARHISLTAYDYGRRLLLAWRTADNELYSLAYHNGAWEETPLPVGQQSDGAITLARLGGAIFLIYKHIGAPTMAAVSYNTAEYNIVTVPSGKFSGPYNNTSINHWSPTAFPVAHFSHGPNPLSPAEDEPLRQPYLTNGTLATGVLDGVIHLAYLGIRNTAILTTTFSLSGIMTAKLPISFDKKNATSTSNGYGTLAQAGWTQTTVLPGAYARPDGDLHMARLRNAVMLLYQPAHGGSLELSLGTYLQDS